MGQHNIIYLFVFLVLLYSCLADDDEELEVEELDERFQCNFCVHSRKKKDIMDEVNQNPDCMNHLKFGSRPDMRRICTDKEKFCMSTVTNLNGFFVFVDRDCTEECVQGCQEHGYGLFYTECTRCCNDTLCNTWDGKEYYRPKSTNGYTFKIIVSLIVCLNLNELI